MIKYSPPLIKTIISKKNKLSIMNIVKSPILFFLLAVGIPISIEIGIGNEVHMQRTLTSESYVEAIGMAAEIYYNDKNNYPENLLELTRGNQYLSNIPTDGEDTANRNTFTLTRLYKSKYQQEIIVRDNVEHSPITLSNLHKFNSVNAWKKNDSLCGYIGCTRIMYNSSNGIMGY